MAKTKKAGVKRLEKRLEKRRAAYDKVVARLERDQQRSVELADAVKTAEQELQKGVAREEARAAKRAASTVPVEESTAAPSPDGSDGNGTAASRGVPRPRSTRRARAAASTSRTPSRRSGSAQPRSRRAGGGETE